jgi:ketosteroid isomerase-like protein
MAAVAMAVAVGGICAGGLLARASDANAKATAGIEQLHKLDEQTTLTDKADELAKLWDKDAVRLEPGEPAEVGKSKIYADDQQWQAEAQKKGVRTLCYRAEIQDVQIHGDWAVEWGYFSFKQSNNPKPGRGKLLRVMKREPNGEWKFTHVTGTLEKADTAAPMKKPCE